MDPYVFTAPPTPPSTSDPTNFNSRADALVAWLVTMTTEHQAFANELSPLFSELALAAGPGGIVMTYTFDGASASVADPGAGKLRLNNLTQGSATALLADNADNLGVSATGRLALLTSTSTIKGTVFAYKVGDPTKWLLASATANTAASGYYNITLTGTQVSSANPFTDGDDVVLILVPKGDKGDTGATGATSLWTTDATYPITGTPTLVTIPLPTGAATCRLSFEDVTIASTQSLTVALSTNGSSFGTAAGFGSASGTLFTGFLTLEGLGRNRLSLEDRVVAGASVPSSPNMSGEGPPNQRFATTTGGATHIQFAVNGGLTFTGGTIVAEKK